MKDIIQIAGIIDRREAQLLLNAGVDWLGFPLRLPVRRENISDDAAAEIIASIQPPAAGWWKYLPNRLCWQGGLNPQNVRQAILQVRPAGGGCPYRCGKRRWQERPWKSCSFCCRSAHRI